MTRRLIPKCLVHFIRNVLYLFYFFANLHYIYINKCIKNIIFELKPLQNGPTPDRRLNLQNKQL